MPRSLRARSLAASLARIALVVACMLASLRAHAAESSSPQVDRTPGNVVLWHAYREAEQTALDAIVDAFRRAHPTAHVEVLAVPFDAYASKLEAAIPHGQGPDVFLDAHERLGDYRERGLVAPIPDTAFDRSAFDLVALRAVSLDDDGGDNAGGHVYALPLASKCLALYLRGPSWPDGRTPTSLDALIAGSARGTAPKLAWEPSNAYGFAPLLHGFSGDMVDASGRYAFDDGPAEGALEWLLAALDHGAIPEEASGALVTQLFSAGSAGGLVGADAAISGPWLAAELPKELDYRVVPVPPVHEGGTPSRPFLTIEGAMLAPAPRDRALALSLMQALVSVEGAVERGHVGRQVVATRAAWSDPLLAGDAVLTGFARAAKDAIPMSTRPAMRAAWEPTTRAIQKVLRRDLGARDAMNEAARRFADVTRAPPPAQSPVPLLWLVGLVALSYALRAVFAARSTDVRREIRDSMPAYAYIAHAVVIVFLLVIVPLLVGAATSFFAGRGDASQFVGFGNYFEILTARGGPLLASGSFYAVLLVTILWTVTNVALHLAIGVSLALLLNRPTLRLRGLYRVLLVVPWAVPSYVSALAWKGMFHRQLGAVNAILQLFGVEPVAWFSRFSTAFAANVTTNVWLGFPFMMVVTLGALAAIPRGVLEAAEIDGATPWQRFWRVTFPLLRPSLGPSVLLGAVWTFNMFNVVFLVSGGEPDGRTEILVSEAYRWAFTRQAQYGYAAAYAVLIFLLLSGFTRGIRAAQERVAT